MIISVIAAFGSNFLCQMFSDIAGCIYYYYKYDYKQYNRHYSHLRLKSCTQAHEQVRSLADIYLIDAKKDVLIPANRISPSFLLSVLSTSAQY